MKKTAVAAGVVINEKGDVLITQRPTDKRLGGYWEFPGGKIEQSESPTEALIRELKEELGIAVKVTGELGVFAYTYDWGEVELHVFTAITADVPRVSADVLTYTWCKPDAISRGSFSPADLEALDILLVQKTK